MTFPLRWTTPMPKPERGSLELARYTSRAHAEKHEREIAIQVKARDGFRCRWPEPHTCRGPLEAAHIQNKSLGGETCRTNEVSLCRWIHRKGPQSVHGQQLKIEKDSAHGADAVLSYWRQDGNYDVLGQPTYYLVGRNGPDGISEKD